MLRGEILNMGPAIIHKINGCNGTKGKKRLEKQFLGAVQSSQTPSSRQEAAPASSPASYKRREFKKRQGMSQQRVWAALGAQNSSWSAALRGPSGHRAPHNSRQSEMKWEE